MLRNGLYGVFVEGKIYGHPMDLFLKISVVKVNFCCLGGVEEITCPWMESVAGKKIGLGVLGLISRITVMAFFPRRSGCNSSISLFGSGA